MYRKIYRFLGKIDTGIQFAEKIVIFLMILTLVLTIFVQVFCRYIFKLPTPAIEELAKYSFIWCCFIGGAYALRNDGHVVINIIDSIINKKKDPKRIYYVLSKITDVFVIAICVFMTRYYYEYWLSAFHGTMLATSLDIPMWIPYSGVLIGLALMVWHAVYMLLAPYEKAPADEEGKE